MSNNITPSSTDRDSTVFTDLVRAHAIAALLALVITALFGLAVSMKMHWPSLMATQPALTWGRLRYDHTQGVFFAWLGNAFLAFMYFAVPKLAQRAVTNRGLGWLLFWLWNIGIVVAGWVMVLAGFSQPLEWAEFPLAIDALVVVAFAISIIQFVLPLLKLGAQKLYVSGWYILGGLVFTLLAYPAGNLVPQLVPGAQGAAFSGLWIHDAIGLYVTPLALAIAYFAIPVITQRPIFSHFLSLVGFWLLFFVYPLNGTHHFVFSAIPMEAQQAAIAASIYLGLDVILVVTNLLLSLRGAGKAMKDPILHFVVAGIVFYLIVSLQGSLQAMMPVNKLLHFSDWVIGHSHLAMIGFASFLAIGGLALAWRELPNERWNPRFFKASSWLMLLGLVIMVVDLSMAGLVEAEYWKADIAWVESLKAVRTFWLMRSFAGALLLSGFVCLLLSFVTGKRNGALLEPNVVISPVVVPEQVAPAPVADGVSPDMEAQQPSPKVVPLAPARRGLDMALLSTFVAGVGFFILSFALLGVFPGMTMQKQLEATRPATSLPLTDAERAGRFVYAREGCAYCHTQQIRTVASDVQRFGAPTRVWETQYDYPHLWGTRRVGPDLSREAGTRSDDWQLAHLYNPRSIVSQSSMPAFPWLFDGAADKPKKECLDLLAYLRCLGKPRQLSAMYGTPVSDQCQCPPDVKRLESMSFPLDTSAHTARRGSQPPVKSYFTVSGEQLTARGAALYAENCAGCHGARAVGDGAAAEALLPEPANLVDSRISAARLRQVLINGIPGSAMPAWRDLSANDIDAIVMYVRSLQPKNEHVAGARASAVSAVADDGARALFNKECAVCHGVNGDGLGPAAGGLPRPPANFQHEQPSLKEAEEVIREGVPGTSMPPWKNQIPEEQRRRLAQYVRTFFKGM